VSELAYDAQVRLKKYLDLSQNSISMQALFDKEHITPYAVRQLLLLWRQAILVLLVVDVKVDT